MGVLWLVGVMIISVNGLVSMGWVMVMEWSDWGFGVGAGCRGVVGVFMDGGGLVVLLGEVGYCFEVGVGVSAGEG